jgi:hypothetical protein
MGIDGIRQLDLLGDCQLILGESSLSLHRADTCHHMLRNAAGPDELLCLCEGLMQTSSIPSGQLQSGLQQPAANQELIVCPTPAQLDGLLKVLLAIVQIVPLVMHGGQVHARQRIDGHLPALPDGLLKDIARLLQLPAHRHGHSLEDERGQRRVEVTRCLVGFQRLCQNLLSFVHLPHMPVGNPQVYGNHATCLNLGLGQQVQRSLRFPDHAWMIAQPAGPVGLSGQYLAEEFRNVLSASLHVIQQRPCCLKLPGQQQRPTGIKT